MATKSLRKALNRVSRIVRAPSRSYHQHTALKKRPLNAHAPIHSLPNEVLGQILAMVPDERWGNYYADLHRIAQVCFLWREIILHEPDFWYLIDINREVDAETVIKRNKGRGVNIRFQGGCIYDFGFDHLLRETAKHPTPWRSLDFETTCSGQHDLSGVPFSNSHLSDLFGIRFHLAYGASPEVFPLPEGELIREVDLRGVSIPWDLKRLLNIRILHLTHLQGSQPTLEQLFTILSASSGLRDLVCSHWSQVTTGQESDLPKGLPDSVTLPHLERLVLISIPISYSHQIYRRIVALNCLSIRISDSLPCLEPDHDLPPFLILKKHLSQGRRLTIQYDAAYSTLRLRTSEVTYVPAPPPPYHPDLSTNELEIKFDVGSASEAWWTEFSAFMTTAGEASEVELVLRSVWDTYPVMTTGDDADDTRIPVPLPLERLGRCFKFITGLAFAGAYDIPSVLRYLAKPYEGDSGPSGWPCPALSACYLVQMGEMYTKRLGHPTIALIDLVRARHQVLGPDAPRRLNRIYVPQEIASLVVSEFDDIKSDIQMFQLVQRQPPYMTCSFTGGAWAMGPATPEEWVPIGSPPFLPPSGHPTSSYMPRTRPPSGYGTPVTVIVQQPIEWIPPSPPVIPQAVVSPHIVTQMHPPQFQPPPTPPIIPQIDFDLH